MKTDFLYDTRNSTLLVIFVVVGVILALACLHVFKTFFPSDKVLGETNATISIFIGVISIFIGVSFAFVVSNVYASYVAASDNALLEASQLFELHKLVSTLPNTESLKQDIIDYTLYVANVEYPSLENGITPMEGHILLDGIGEKLYMYDPQGQRENAIFNKAVGVYNDVVTLKVARLASAQSGIAPELWWVLIIGSILIIIMTWFVKCSLELQYVFTAITTAALASMIFLIVALDYPFRGDYGLDSEPFLTSAALMAVSPA